MTWTAKPWECPGCCAETVLVRNMRMPGANPPGIVMRICHISYEAKCTTCGTHWIAYFVPSHVQILQDGRRLN